jgi:3-isopropylmalate/(R)-2-methylmalate dehydratase small subunit
MAIEKIRRLAGSGLPLRGNDIDTDRIIPARYLRSVSFEGLEHHLFVDDISQATGRNTVHPLTDPKYAGASILIVNRNFGCGSSREHAPQAIRRRGYVAVVGESFSEIFFGNSVALGLPCVSASHEDVDRLQRSVEEYPASAIVIDLDALQLRCGDMTVAVALPAAARESFLDGSWDATGQLLDRFEQVEETVRRLPYVRGWSGLTVQGAGSEVR